MSGIPLPPDRLGPRLAEVYDLLGPLYRRVLRRVERDQPTMGMSTGVRALLHDLVASGPATVPTIARRQDLSRQFVQRTVNDALARSWVRLEDNPAHRRSSVVHPTPKGEAAIARVVAREHALMGDVGGDLTDAEVTATLRVLSHMLRALPRLEDET